MKYLTYLTSFCLALLIVDFSLIQSHGVGPSTLIQIEEGRWKSIKNICEHPLNKSIKIVSYNPSINKHSVQLAIARARSQINCYLKIKVEKDFSEEIICSPAQEFYCPISKEWVSAYNLKVGDILLSKGSVFIPITYIELVKENLNGYSIEIEETHTFLVGAHCILTHNMAIPIACTIGISIPLEQVLQEEL